MKIVVFCHSLISDWNHGSAHFLRGVVSELIARGVDVQVFEPKEIGNELQDFGDEAPEGFQRTYPDIRPRTFDPETVDIHRALAGADAVLVHDWNDPDLIQAIGEHRRTKGHYVLLYYDTHVGSAPSEAEILRSDLAYFDGVLAVGSIMRDAYLKHHWSPQAWTWHEGADTRIFHPIPSPKKGDLVWIGNWREGESAITLRRYLLEPVRRMGIRARAYGASFPASAIRDLERAGIEYGGWLPNYRVPQIYARYRATVYIPPKAQDASSPVVPTMSLFESMACGIPVISAPWTDSERLFTKADFLAARNSEEMQALITWVLHNEAAAREIALHGRRTILERHTCSHRADELLQIVDMAQKDAVRQVSA